MTELWTPESVDGNYVARLLHDYDPELRLVPQPSDEYGCIVWQVRRYAGNDRPSELICVWANDHGEPYPLSSRIIEKVQELDRNTRSRSLDADVRNELKRQAEASQWERDVEAIADEWNPKHGRAVLQRGVGLKQARDRRRARGEKC